MMYKSTTKRLLATSVVAVLLPGVVGSAYLVPAVAHAEVKTVACKVTAFLVQKDGDGIIPAELKFVGALVVLIAVLLVRPQGLLGRAERVG